MHSTKNCAAHWGLCVFAVLLFGAATAEAQDIGVLKGRQGCPAGTTEVSIVMDNEDKRPASRISGWVGASTIDGNRNLTLRFCKTPAAPFLNAPGPFAVLALGTCPAQSWQVLRRFDADNMNNLSHFKPSAGAAQPNFMTYNETWVYFCVFQGVPGGTFPQLGKEYGVFTDTWHLPQALEFGEMYSDDEDGDSQRDNVNSYYGPSNFDVYFASPNPLTDVYCCHTGLRPTGYSLGPQLTYIRGVKDTLLSTARVTSTPPPTNPVAMCTADPSNAVNYAWASFVDSGSYGRNGRYITAYAWRFPDGTTANTPGPHYHFFQADPGHSEYFQAQLTVTDNAGETGTTTCGVHVASDQCSNPGGTCVSN